MLGDEVDLIWKRPTKTNVILYIAIRYFPLAVVIVKLLPNPPWFSVLYTFVMLAIMAFAQVLLQMRAYAIYHKSKTVLWTNAVLFISEIAIVIVLVFRTLFIEQSQGSFAVGYITPLCYELYLAVLVLRKSWINREYSRQLGARSTLDMLARGSGFYFIFVACGLALSLILFVVAPDYSHWVDMATNATSSIGGAGLILSVQKAIMNERDEFTAHTGDIALDFHSASFPQRDLRSEVSDRNTYGEAPPIHSGRVNTAETSTFM